MAQKNDKEIRVVDWSGGGMMITKSSHPIGADAWVNRIGIGGVGDFKGISQIDSPMLLMRYEQLFERLFGEGEFVGWEFAFEAPDVVVIRLKRPREFSNIEEEGIRVSPREILKSQRNIRTLRRSKPDISKPIVKGRKPGQTLNKALPLPVLSRFVNPDVEEIATLVRSKDTSSGVEQKIPFAADERVVIRLKGESAKAFINVARNRGVLSKVHGHLPDRYSLHTERTAQFEKNLAQQPNEKDVNRFDYGQYRVSPSLKPIEKVAGFTPGRISRSLERMAERIRLGRKDDTSDLVLGREDKELSAFGNTWMRKGKGISSVEEGLSRGSYTEAVFPTSISLIGRQPEGIVLGQNIVRRKEGILERIAREITRFSSGGSEGVSVWNDEDIGFTGRPAYFKDLIWGGERVFLNLPYHPITSEVMPSNVVRNLPAEYNKKALPIRKIGGSYGGLDASSRLIQDSRSKEEIHHGFIEGRNVQFAQPNLSIIGMKRLGIRSEFTTSSPEQSDVIIASNSLNGISLAVGIRPKFSSSSSYTPVLPEKVSEGRITHVLPARGFERGKSSLEMVGKVTAVSDKDIVGISPEPILKEGIKVILGRSGEIVSGDILRTGGLSPSFMRYISAEPHRLQIENVRSLLLGSVYRPILSRHLEKVVFPQREISKVTNLEKIFEQGKSGDIYTTLNPIFAFLTPTAYKIGAISQSFKVLQDEQRFTDLILEDMGVWEKILVNLHTSRSNQVYPERKIQSLMSGGAKVFGPIPTILGGRKEGLFGALYSKHGEGIPRFGNKDSDEKGITADIANNIYVGSVVSRKSMPLSNQMVSRLGVPLPMVEGGGKIISSPLSPYIQAMVMLARSITGGIEGITGGFTSSTSKGNIQFGDIFGFERILLSLSRASHESTAYSGQEALRIRDLEIRRGGGGTFLRKFSERKQKPVRGGGIVGETMVDKGQGYSGIQTHRTDRNIIPLVLGKGIGKELPTKESYEKAILPQASLEDMRQGFMVSSLPSGMGDLRLLRRGKMGYVESQHLVGYEGGMRKGEYGEIIRGGYESLPLVVSGIGIKKIQSDILLNQQEGGRFGLSIYRELEQTPIETSKTNFREQRILPRLVYREESDQGQGRSFRKIVKGGGRYGKTPLSRIMASREDRKGGRSISKEAEGISGREVSGFEMLLPTVGEKFVTIEGAPFEQRWRFVKPTAGGSLTSTITFEPVYIARGVGIQEPKGLYDETLPFGERRKWQEEFVQISAPFMNKVVLERLFEESEKGDRGLGYGVTQKGLHHHATFEKGGMYTNLYHKGSSGANIPDAMFGKARSYVGYRRGLSDSYDLLILNNLLTLRENQQWGGSKKEINEIRGEMGGGNLELKVFDEAFDLALIHKRLDKMIKGDETNQLWYELKGLQNLILSKEGMDLLSISTSKDRKDKKSPLLQESAALEYVELPKVIPEKPSSAEGRLPGIPQSQDKIEWSIADRGFVRLGEMGVPHGAPPVATKPQNISEPTYKGFLPLVRPAIQAVASTALAKSRAEPVGSQKPSTKDSTSGMKQKEKGIDLDSLAVEMAERIMRRLKKEKERRGFHG